MASRTMNFIVCDRCDVVLPSKDNPNQTLSEGLISGYVLFAEFVLIQEPGEDSPRKADLCKACVREVLTKALTGLDVIPAPLSPTFPEFKPKRKLPPLEGDHIPIPVVDDIPW